MARFGDLDVLPRTLHASGSWARTAAAFTPDVVAARRAGDPVAAGILDDAVRLWTDLVAGAAAAARREAGRPSSVAWPRCPASSDRFAAALPDHLLVAPAAGHPARRRRCCSPRAPTCRTRRSCRRTTVDRPQPHRTRTGHRTVARRRARDRAGPRRPARPDRRSPAGWSTVLLEAEATVPAALAARRRALADAVALADAALRDGGRLLYVGAGTPGRLAALDAAECPPTFGTAPDRVVAVLAGGARRRRAAVEGAEDDAAAGARDLPPSRPVPATSSSGSARPAGRRTSWRPCDAARAAGAATVAIVNNAGQPRGRDACRRRRRAAHRPRGAGRVDPAEGRHRAEDRPEHALDRRDGGARQDLRRLDGRRARLQREAASPRPADPARGHRLTDDEALAALERTGWSTRAALTALLGRWTRDRRRRGLGHLGRRSRRRAGRPGSRPGRGPDITVLDARTDPWPDGLADQLLALLPPAATSADALCFLDSSVGQAVADAAAAPSRRSTGRRTWSSRPGQTVYHDVRDGHCLGTLQLGQPAWVAERTGLPVVSDLRARDVAAGGHGAPLASTLDALWLAAPGGPRAALDLGGIASVTVVRDEEEPVLAWDTGPANCLLDVAAARVTDGRQTRDDDGRLAAAGTVVTSLLDQLLEHPHFTLAPPVSTAARRSRRGTSTTCSTATARCPGRTCSPR